MTLTRRIRSVVFLLSAGAFGTVAAGACTLLVDGVVAKRVVWAATAVVVSVAAGWWRAWRDDPRGTGRAAGGAIPAASPQADPDSLPVLLSPGRAITDPDEAEALGPTDPTAYQDLVDALTAIRFHDIARAEAHRLILCEPHREHQIRAAVDQLGAADVLTVRASPHCPEGKLLVIDTGAIEASEREWVQRMSKGWRMSP